MPSCYHIDYETFSRADLKKVGAYRYAEDPSTSVLLVAVARDNRPPVLWDCTDPEGPESLKALALLEEVALSGCPIYAHNAPFEIAISENLWESTFQSERPGIDQWRCTMAMARRAGMPSDLGELGGALVDEQSAFGARKKNKDAAGKQLIKIFCCPRTAGKLKGTRIMPDEDGVVTFQGKKIAISEAWELFRQYNREDVVKEQEVYKQLKAFDLKGIVLCGFQFDARMNLRGLPVNRDALDKARTIVEEASREDFARCKKLCGLNPTQVAKLLLWLRERGYPGDNLQEETADLCLMNPPDNMAPEAIEVLQIRSRVAFSAVKKIPTMLSASCSDGRIRGCLKWSGAVRTHRWTGQIVQPQNFKRPSIKNTHDAYQHIRDGWDHEMLGMVYGNPVEVVASCIRHFIQAKDCEFLDSDFSNIEARITPWLAGQLDLLQAFRDGRDPYVELAAMIFDKPDALPTEKEIIANDLETIKGRYNLITKEERFVGKQGILAAGFQVGGEKFQAMCAKFGRDLPIELCNTTIEVYREKNDMIASMWKAVSRAAIQAVTHPGTIYKVRGKLTFGMASTLPYPALLMRLPSGHHLIYPYPRLKDIWMYKKTKYTTEGEAWQALNRAKVQAVKDKEEWDDQKNRVWKTTQITFYGPDPIAHQWGRQSTYGGKLLENAVQATAGDFMAHGMVHAEKAGYEIFLTVHDQALSHYRPEKGHTKEGFREALCTLPDWASDFPLEATCDITPFYTKD